MRDQKDGVFDYLVDVAAFVDRIDVSVWEKNRPTGKVSNVLSAGKSFPIAGFGGMYARAVNGICRVTGNPFQKRYGRLVRFSQVPSAQLMLRSCGTPVSGAQVDFVLSSLAARGVRTSVSAVELTFDLTGTSVVFLMQHVHTRARTMRYLTDSQGYKTLYVGARRSQWQVRTYDKAPGVVRFEFVFRRAFLRKHGIERPCQLLLLRKIDLAKLISLRRLDAERIGKIEKRSEIAGNLRRRVLCTLARFSTVQQFCKLVKQTGTRCPEFFVPCALEAKLRLMQRRMIW